MNTPENTKPCGHVPADPNAQKTACELCGAIIQPDSETGLWHDARVAVHERGNPPCEAVLKARAGLLPRDPHDDEPDEAPEPIAVFNDRELNTVLHSLEILREVRESGSVSDWNGCWAREEFRRRGSQAETACDHFEEAEPLTNAEIGALCDRLQLQPVQTPDSDAPQAARELQAAIEKFNCALQGDSGDEESDAACEMRDAALELVRALKPGTARGVDALKPGETWQVV